CGQGTKPGAYRVRYVTKVEHSKGMFQRRAVLRSRGIALYSPIPVKPALATFSHKRRIAFLNLPLRCSTLPRFVLRCSLHLSSSPRNVPGLPGVKWSGRRTFPASGRSHRPAPQTSTTTAFAISSLAQEKTKVRRANSVCSRSTEKQETCSGSKA